MVKIRDISALEILDSRGDPTLSVTVHATDGTSGEASVPSGASTGAFEAYELRDGDPRRYGGKGVSRAVKNVVTEIRDALIGMEITRQGTIDRAMIDLDGTLNKKRLGANAILGVSLAAARAAAASQGLPLYRSIRNILDITGDYHLPVPLVNVINGGKHASSNINIQEFWIIPFAVSSFKERLRQASEVFHALGLLLNEKGMDTDLGNEGGYAPDVESHAQILDLIMRAIHDTSLEAGKDIRLGLDVGSSVLFDADSKSYRLPLEKKNFSANEFQDFLKSLLEKYPIGAIEDPLGEESWADWKTFTAWVRGYNPEIAVIGDDLFVTNASRLSKGIEERCANSVLIKPNQIGTLTETLDCIRLAREHTYRVAVSHRSGETTDTFIADLAVAVNADFIKTGSTARGERLAKYNRLLEIEHELETND